MAGLYWLRPASPFEWDEVLFQRALDRFDISRHSPHPPGYPVYVAMGRLLRLAVGEPMLALQLASIVGAALAALALWHLARRVGASRPSAIASVGLLLATPAFAFHANVGLSDVTASAAGLLTVLSLVWALEEPAWLPLAALSIGLSTGVRPQLLALVAPLGLVVAFRATRERGLRALAAGALCGLAGLVVVWVPAVLATGPRFFLDAFTAQMTGVIVEESGLRLPAAPFGLIAASWLVDPFGAPWLAVAFWLLVCLGTCSWLRSGKRTLVAVAAGAGGSYLLAAMFLLNRTTSARYVLPAMPFLALLAAGAVGWPRRGLRFLSQAAVLVWMGFAVRWLLPVCLIRTESAPLWASLAFVEQNFEPGRTTVLFDPAFLPHVEYVLGARGFNATALPAVDDHAASQARPGDDVLMLTPRSDRQGACLFARSWKLDRLALMTGGRYEACLVSRLPHQAVPRPPRLLLAAPPVVPSRPSRRPRPSIEVAAVPLAERAEEASDAKPAELTAAALDPAEELDDPSAADNFVADAEDFELGDRPVADGEAPSPSIEPESSRAGRTRTVFRARSAAGPLKAPKR